LDVPGSRRGQGHRNRWILSSALLGGSVHGRLLPVLQVSYEKNRENEEDRERNQSNSTVEEFFA
jgi:hypothetical protein